jgi:hypothetical protein
MANVPNLGRGVNSLSGEFQGQVLDVSDTVPVGRYAAPYNLSYVRESSQLQSILEISMRAKGGFGIGSASARLNYFKETNFTSLSCALVAEVNVNHGGQMILSSSVGEKQLTTLKNAGKMIFFEKFGDRHIDQILYGGRLAIAFIYTATTASEFEDMEASLSGSYGGFSAFADFVSRIQSARSFKAYKIIADVIGISDHIEVQGDQDKVLEFIAHFPEKVTKFIDSIDPTDPVHGKNIIDFSTAETMDVGNFPDNVNLRAKAARDRLVELKSAHAEAVTIDADVRAAQKNPDKYADFSLKGIDSLHREVEKCIRKIESDIDSVCETPFSVGTEDYNSSEYDLDRFRRNKPLLRGAAQPAILAKFSHRFDNSISTKRINSPKDPDFSGYIGLNESGGRVWLTAFSLELEPDIERLQLLYRASFFDGHETGWLSGELASSGSSELKGVAIKLSGSLADQYALKFMLHFSDISNAGPFDGGENIVYTDMIKPIENIRISLKPLTS